jgi:hypothetical protein
MAYETSNPIKKVAGGVGGAPSIWTYEDGDALTAIDASGYFNAEAARLKVGDRIEASAASNTYGVFIVVSNTRDLTASPVVEGVVDVSNAVSLGAIESD